MPPTTFKLSVKVQGLLITTVLALVYTGLCSAALPRLSRFELTRYQAWVKNLQPDSTYVQVEKIYFPGFEKVKPEWERLQTERMASATRSVISIEDIMIREWDKAELITAKQCLGVARSYRLASEYDDAVQWFDRAFAEKGYTYPPPPRLAEEIFATAILTCDSLTITRELLNIIGNSDLSGYDNSIILGLRQLIARRDQINLLVLQDKIEGQQERLRCATRYWYAYSLVATGRYSSSLKALRALVGSASWTGELSQTECRWVLRALPDLLYVLGQQDEARRYYQLLAEAPSDHTAESGAWARYQIANYLLREGDYEAAEAAYHEFRDSNSEVPWQVRARKMMGILEELVSIKKEGTPYGIDDIHVR